MQETSEERPPGSACPGKKRLRCHAHYEPTREPVDARLGRRPSRTDNSWHLRTCGDTLLESSSTCAIGSDEVADARAPSTPRHVRRPTMAFPSLLHAPQASRLRDRPDDRNCAQLRLPRSFLRRRLLRFVPTRRMELRTASLPSLIFAPQATRLRGFGQAVSV